MALLVTIEVCIHQYSSPIPSFSTSKLDEILRDRREKCEQERKQLLQKTQAWLEEFASEYGIETAYIFGSVTRPHKFRQNRRLSLPTPNQDQGKHASQNLPVR